MPFKNLYFMFILIKSGSLRRSSVCGCFHLLKSWPRRQGVLYLAGLLCKCPGTDDGAGCGLKEGCRSKKIPLCSWPESEPSSLYVPKVQLIQLITVWPNVGIWLRGRGVRVSMLKHVGLTSRSSLKEAEGPRWSCWLLKDKSSTEWKIRVC